MFTRLFQIVAIVLVLAGGTLSACAPRGPASEPDRVILQFNWVHATQFVGYYVAEAKGFYAAENIAVTFHEDPSRVDAPNILMSRAADFAVLSFPQRQQLGPSAVATAALYQISPRVLFALSDSDIRRPHDLVSRRVGIKSQGWRNTVHQTLIKVGLDPAQLVEVEVRPEALDMLYNHEVDVWTGYVTEEVVQTRLAGYDLNLIFPADYAVGNYDGLLVVHQELLAQKPDLVERFVRASLRGWQYAIEHATTDTDEVVEILQVWEHVSTEFHRTALHGLLPLIDTGQVPIGWIDDRRWRREMEEIDPTYNPEQLGYTVQFIKRRPLP